VAHAWQRPTRGATSFTAVAEGTASVDGVESAVEDHLQAIVEAELDDPSLVSTTVALRGGVAAALRKDGGRAGAPPVVVGASGAGGALRALLGSASRALTECPARAVVVVPGHHARPGAPAGADAPSGPGGEPWCLVVG